MLSTSNEPIFSLNSKTAVETPERPVTVSALLNTMPFEAPLYKDFMTAKSIIFLTETDAERRSSTTTQSNFIFVKKEILKEAGRIYPIKLEYYKIINEDEIIKNRRIALGYSLRNLANEVGISHTELVRIENGNRQCLNTITLLKICKLLNLDFLFYAFFYTLFSLIYL